MFVTCLSFDYMQFSKIDFIMRVKVWGVKDDNGFFGRGWSRQGSKNKNDLLQKHLHGWQPQIFLCFHAQSCLQWSHHTIIHQVSHLCSSMVFREMLQPMHLWRIPRSGSVGSYSQMKEQIMLYRYFCFETKENLHLGLWYHKWHYIMLSICLSLPCLP